MSKKELLASSLEQLSDLCFTISGLVLEDVPGEEKDAGPSTSGLSPEAKVFVPSRKGKEKETESPKALGSKPSVSSCDWESVPDLQSVKCETPPTFSQVVASASQSVFVTPARRVAKLETDQMAQAPNFAQCTAADFDQWWTHLPDDVSKMAAETAALSTGNDAVKIAALMKRDQRNAATLAAVKTQLAQAQAANPVNPAKLAAPSRFENKEKDGSVRVWLNGLELYLGQTPDNQYLQYAASYLGGKPKNYWNN